MYPKEMYKNPIQGKPSGIVHCYIFFEVMYLCVFQFSPVLILFEKSIFNLPQQEFWFLTGGQKRLSPSVEPSGGRPQRQHNAIQILRARPMP